MSNGVKFTHHDFKGKFYAVFSISMGFPYKVNVFVKTSFIADFHFPETTESLIVTLNSSRSQKAAILGFTFTVNTFLSLGNLADSDIFVVLNVGGLHSLDKISDNWLDVIGNPCLKYALNVS